MKSRLLALVICCGLTGCSEPPSPLQKQQQHTEGETAKSDFHAVLDDHWATVLTEKIYFREDPDAWRMDGRLSEHTAAARERRRIFNTSVLSRLAEINPQQLNAADRLSFRIFAHERKTERDSYSQLDHRFPFTSLFGYHTYFAEAPANMAFLNASDYDKYLVSLADFPRYNREKIALLEEGVATGYTHYCASIASYASTISTHIVDQPEDSLLYLPFKDFPALISGDQQAAYRTQGLALIQDKVVPAYQALLDYFEGEYLPNCRESVGITSLPGGDEYYAYLIRYFTTTEMMPKQIHDLGLQEVARIRAEMQAIITQLGFDGDFKDFLEYLRTDPKFYARTEDELLGRAALISKTAEGALPRFFSLLPRETYKISPNSTRGSFYMPSSGDGTTSGTYFVSTGDLNSEPLYALEALTLHEAVPGHHLQTALAAELDMPTFRGNIYYSAYGEGWGLYSERLGKEMGFYQDPYSDFGRLSYEAWRACRLVVDTGMHAFGWSRQQAIDYMLENTALSVSEATREIDRYITWPAQALSYKIGELKIRELRARAEQALGPRFDIRSFHDTVLGNGSLPIAVLEELVNEWIDEPRG
jgi:uncharacterized protein (DUF885 family)